jgi:Holliday junction DNA helicase RuvA
MIDFLAGVLADKQPTHVVVQCGGVGFRLPIPLSSFDALPRVGDAVQVQTRLVVREDDLILFGFATAAERDMFDLLVQVSGIGPKIALAALSGMSVREIKRSLVDSDVKRLSGISGIGKKTAERMIVELRDKLGKADVMELQGSDAAEKNPRLRDAVLALVALGYKQQEARRKVEQVPGFDKAEMSVEELIRKALAG